MARTKPLPDFDVITGPPVPSRPIPPSLPPAPVSMPAAPAEPGRDRP